MITDWQTLVDALREEVTEYGGLLNLFEKQQAAILRREADVVLSVNDSIELQVRIIEVRRKEREAVVRLHAAGLGKPLDISLKDLTNFFEEPVRPLLLALIDEVNSLVSRSRRRAQQNQILLARCIEVSQQILQRLNPAGVTTTYTPNGRVMVAVSDPQPRCIAKS
jgi:flagellar biosynthesis/type III secretory pathway chaperone